jgi:hypothetical protein
VNYARKIALNAFGMILIGNAGSISLCLVCKFELPRSGDTAVSDPNTKIKQSHGALVYEVGSIITHIGLKPHPLWCVVVDEKLI